MNLRSAYPAPSGKFIKNEEGIYTFFPDFLPPKIKYDDELISLLTRASGLINKLSGMGLLLPNPHILIQPYIKKEAVLSSKIEGTQASLSDLYLYEIEKKENPKGVLRLKEVNNYVRTTEYCLYQLRKKKRTISLSLIQDAHKHLLKGVRGEKKFPGKFRFLQNWIGPEGRPIEEAVYIPPYVDGLRTQLFSLENFIKNYEGNLPNLIQTALVHYQFEAIHPFTDGNGRIGRLIITLFLCERGELSHPLLYLSAFFEEHKQEYYRVLRRVSSHSEWENWIKFFLEAVIVQSEKIIKNVEDILKLRKHYYTVARKKKFPPTTSKIIEFLFSNPYLTISDVKKHLKVTYPTAKRAVEVLVKNEILELHTERVRNKIFVAKDLINLLNV